MKHRIFLQTLGLCALALFPASCSKSPDSAEKSSPGTPAAKTLKFSAIPDQNKTNLEKFNAIATYLSKELGVPVEYVASPDYSTSVTSFKNGDIQLAWFGGLTGVQAREAIPGATAIAQGDSDPKFIAYIIAHKDSGLTPADAFPTGIGAVPFSFGEPQSTSGRLMPQYFIEQATGTTIDKFFTKGLNYSKGHDATAEVVASGAMM